MTTTTRRAIGIVRVSQVKRGKSEEATKEREEAVASLVEQEQRIRDAAERDNLELIEVIPEPDVSGGTPLEKRSGLRRAVEAVEAGTAEVVIAAYFDRLVRSLRVQEELVRRVEAAEGQVMAVDVGAVTNGSSGQWLSGGVLGLVAEYQRRTTAERTLGAQVAAMKRGVAPWPGATLGYNRNAEGEHVPDPGTKDAVAEAFDRRANGASISEVREHLRERGVDANYNVVQRLLRSRIVLGELHFGDHEPNLTAHDPIVDRAIWERAQRVHVSRGRKPKSERLLARLDILHCAACGARLSAGSAKSGTYPVYGHPHTVECDQRVTISAELVERLVSDDVRAHLADVEGRATAAAAASSAIALKDQAQAKLDAAIRTLAALADEPATIETITKLRDARDAAQEKVDRLGGEGAAVTVTTAKDWERLSLKGRRDLIRATVSRVTIAPGRGPSRVTIELLGE